MIEQSLAHPAHPETRETIAKKALRLYPERTVEPLGHGRYSVEGSGGNFYEVDLAVFGAEESCPCPATKPCYHIALATISRAKRRGEAHRATSTTGGEDVSGKPRASGGAVIRAILAGLLFAAPSFVLVLVTS